LQYLLFISFLSKSPDKEQEKNRNNKSFGALISNIEGQIVKTSRLENDIEVSGTIFPFDETIIMSEVSGKVVKLNLLEGRLVQKGTMLLKLFDDDLQAQLRMLDVQLKIAENNEERMNKLFKVNGTSQQELMQAFSKLAI